MSRPWRMDLLQSTTCGLLKSSVYAPSISLHVPLGSIWMDCTLKCNHTERKSLTVSRMMMAPIQSIVVWLLSCVISNRPYPCVLCSFSLCFNIVGLHTALFSLHDTPYVCPRSFRAYISQRSSSIIISPN